MRSVGLILLLGTALAYGGPIVDFSTVGFTNPDSVWSLGFEFTANNNVWITALGVFDYQQDGFPAGPQRVALWTTDGTLLASTYVASTDVLTGLFRYHAITPVNLVAGTSYIVGSQGGEGYTGFYTVAPPSSWTVDPNITYVINRWGDNHGSYDTDPLVFPDSTDGPATLGYFGANAEIGNPAVPEPASLLLFGTGLTALFAWRRPKHSPLK